MVWGECVWRGILSNTKESSLILACTTKISNDLVPLAQRLEQDERFVPVHHIGWHERELSCAGTCLYSSPGSSEQVAEMWLENILS